MVQIQGYTTLKFLGGGGFGKVYLARHNQTGNLVALKTLKPEIATDPCNREMFLREIKNSKALNHTNIVQTLDYRDLDIFCPKTASKLYTVKVLLRFSYFLDILGFERFLGV